MHENRVLALANRLRNEGVETILDRYEEFGPSPNWNLWMTKHLRDGDFVVMICTERYYARAMGDEVTGKGRGVRFEINLILEYLNENDSANRRFLPVLLKDGKAEYIPDPFRSSECYSVDDEDGYDKLYRRLTNQPSISAPAIGKIRILTKKSHEQDVLGTRNPTDKRNNDDTSCSRTHANVDDSKPLLHRKASIDSAACVSPKSLSMSPSKTNSSRKDALKSKSSSNWQKSICPRNSITTARLRPLTRSSRNQGQSAANEYLTGDILMLGYRNFRCSVQRQLFFVFAGEF